MNNLENLSSAELEKLLAEKKKQEKEQRQKLKREYEAKRDAMVSKMVNLAIEQHIKLKEFKDKAMAEVEAFRELAKTYGDIKSNSKGGFGLRTKDQKYMMVLDRNTKPEYDERAGMAEQLLKEFLEDKVKKHDLKVYRTISALMERNKKGDYTPARIASLLKIKDNYDDVRWIKAMELFEESFQNRTISMSLSFYIKDENGKDQLISLSFPSL